MDLVQSIATGKDLGQLDGETLPIDFANAASSGAEVIRANNRDELADALLKAQQATVTTCIVVETDRRQRVPATNCGGM